MQTVKQQIFAKLLEIEQLLETATCDNVVLTDASCETVNSEIVDAINAVVEAVDYYID